MLVLPLAGLLSAVLTILACTAISLSLFAGAIFAGVLSVYLVEIGVLSNSQAARLIIVAGVAYVLSFLAAAGVDFALGSFGLLTKAEEGSLSMPPSPSPISLCAAGLLGGFLLTGEVLFLVRSNSRTDAIIREALSWSVLGGALAVVGWLFAPSLGVFTFRAASALGLARGSTVEEASLESSLFFVWQTGMALAIASILQRRDAQLRLGEPKQP